MPRVFPYLNNWQEEFENEFCKYIGGLKAFSTISGSEALYIILRALGIKSVEVEDETCPKVFWSIKRAGAERKSCGEAIITTHFLGIPKEVKRGQVVSIEDCCQCVGAKIGNKMVGSIADISIFSFGYDKPISTDGGGMIVVNNPKYLQAIHLADFQRLGQMKSLIGLDQLRNIDKIVAERNEKAKYISKFIKPSLPILKGTTPAFMRYPVKKTKWLKGWSKLDCSCIPLHSEIGYLELLKIIKKLNGKTS